MRFTAELSMTAVLLCLAASAAAQSTSPREPVPSDDAAATSAPTLVTARLRAEDAQQVPSALSVVGGDLLDQSFTVNTQGIATLIPSLNYSSANPRNTAFTIRGLGSSVVAVSQANDGLEPGVGFCVVQVYDARRTSSSAILRWRSTSASAIG